MFKRKYLFFFILLFAYSFVHGQRYVTNYQHIGITKGLSDRQVYGFFYDKSGFLWFNSERLIQRYDGYEFKKYPLDLHRYDVQTVVQIGNASDNWLWIHNLRKSDQKYDIKFFNPNTNEVLTSEERYGPKLSNQLHGLLNMCKYCYFVYDSENLYFIENNDLIKFDLAGQSYRFKIRDDIAEGENRLYIKLIDEDGKIWIRSSDTDDFYIIDIEINEIKELESFKIKESQANSRIYGSKDNVYLSSFIEDELGNRFIRISDLRNASEPILQYKKDAKFIGSIDDLFWFLKGNSLMVYDSKDQLQFTFEFEEKETPIFRTNRVNPFLKGPSGKIFMKNIMGLYIFDITKSPFKTYFTKNKKRPLPFENSIRGIATDENFIYANVEFGDLVKIPKDTSQHFSVIFQKKEKYGIYNGRPLLIDSKDEFYTGHNNFISKWDSEWNEVRINSQNPKGPLNEANSCWALWEDPNSCIWAVNNANIKKFCAESANSTNYTNAELGFSVNERYVYQIIKDESFDQNRILWWSTHNGLFSFQYDKMQVIDQYNRHQSGDTHLAADIVYHMHIDSIGDKWLATNNGLIHWSKKTNTKTSYNQENGFLNEVIYAVYEDDYGRMWMSSDLGIIRFDKTTKDVHTYLPDDGVAQEEFNRISHHQSENGTIYFGGLNGITAFNPKDFVEENKEYEKVVLSDFQTFDGKEEQLVNKLEEISKHGRTIFKPSDKFIKLKFTFPTFDQYNKPLFAWKIDGVFDDWTYQKENTLQFGSLPYGKHDLIIKAQDDNGGWSPNELKIGITVQKPFYLQTWFLLLSSILLIGGILLYVRSRINKLNQDKEKLKHEIAKATEQILKDKSILEKQAEELSQLEKLKSRFFANVSHELRTPLSLMIGPIKRLKSSIDSSGTDGKLLGFLERNSIHLKKLVNEILDLSKLESGKLEVFEEEIDFYPYIKNHISQFYSYSELGTINISAKFPHEHDLTLSIDKLKFEKIINNFLSNAIKFTPSDGTILFTVLEEEEKVVVEVKDTGRGIHPDDLEHIFDRFYQSKHADVKQEGGTGIGLSLCQELAELLGGRVWAKSTLGKGSTFFFEFPKKLIAKTQEVPLSHRELDLNKPDNSGQADVQNEIDSSVKDKKHITILIAEDNNDLREYYGIILSDYNLILKENGKEAVDYLQRSNEKPDLIISDLMMPVMDGMQFLSALKTDDRWRHIPVVMLTAKMNRNSKIHALRIGVDDYITKPFDDEELLVRINNLLSYARSKSDFNQQDIITNKESSLVISHEEQEWLTEFETYILTNISSDLLTVESLCKSFAMSPSTLLRQVKKLTGLTPLMYLKELRLNHARELLESRTYKSISTVGHKVGYSNKAAFSRAFKGRFGITPKDLFLNY